MKVCDYKECNIKASNSICFFTWTGKKMKYDLCTDHSDYMEDLFNKSRGEQEA